MTDPSETPVIQPTAQELAEVIAGFEQYREQLISETMATAQRTNTSKATVMARLEPELAKIDAALASLREQQTTATDPP